jgi:hypothetical protein
MASNGKMTQLKTASHNLLTTLKNAAKQLGDVKVAVVPFDKIVNIGTSYAASGWVDYSVHNIQQAQGRAAYRIATSPTTRRIRRRPRTSTPSIRQFPARWSPA